VFGWFHDQGVGPRTTGTKWWVLLFCFFSTPPCVPGPDSPSFQAPNTPVNRGGGTPRMELPVSGLEAFFAVCFSPDYYYFTFLLLSFSDISSITEAAAVWSGNSEASVLGWTLRSLRLCELDAGIVRSQLCLLRLRQIAGALEGGSLPCSLSHSNSSNVT